MNHNSVVQKKYNGSLFYADSPYFTQDICYNVPSRIQTDYEYNGAYDETDDPADYYRAIKGVRIA